MTADQIEKRLNALPYRAFEMCLADGRALLVEHPDLLAFGSRKRVVTLCTKASQVETIDLMLVLSLRFSDEDFIHETQPAPAAPGDSF